jgi:TolB-like protein
MIAAAIMLICAPVQAEAPKKILLMPFALYAGDDLAYLQKGISQMLISRLTQPDKVEVIQADPAWAEDPDPTEKARAAGADYMLTGSITLLGGSVSTDAQVTDLHQHKQVVAFNRTGKDQAVIIDHVDQLAARINADLFATRGGSQAAAVTPPPPGGTPPEPSIYQHPEKLYTQSMDENNPVGPKPGQMADAALMFRGRRVDFRMQGVTTGDVDGDGQNDIVCIGPDKVVVYRENQQQLAKLTETKARGAHYVGVDAADLNGNGRAEIFVTNFYAVDSLVTSLVLEWDGRKLVTLAKNLNWYFRALDVPHRGRILAAQRQGVDKPFGSTIHEVGLQGDQYTLMDRLPLPRGLNIYGVAYGDIRSTHDTEVTAYTDGGFVRILNPGGKEEWVTSERYGGSHLFIEFPDPGDVSDRQYIFLSPRIHLWDLDADGRQEIMVIRNETTSGAFKRVRIFKNGRLEALKWDELGLTSQWRTRNLAKYISDFALGDMDGDGKPEVVAAVVQKSGSLLSDARSYLAVFKLEVPPQTH